MGFGLDGPGSIPGRGKIFLLLHIVQAGSGVHPASYLMGIGSSFPGSKAAEASSSYPSSAKVKNGGGIPSFRHTSSWHSAELFRHKENFTF
jgi:hypothetical protein